jgi:hypothetical protein
MPETVFHEKVARIIEEELEPRGLVLLMRELPGGRIRFLVKAVNTGRVCDLVEYPPEETPAPYEDQIGKPVFSDGTLHICR